MNNIFTQHQSKLPVNIQVSLYHSYYRLFPVSLILSVLLFSVVGCSSIGVKDHYPTQIDVDVKSSPLGKMDLETQRRSDTIHNYLVGRFAYVHEDYDKAKMYYENTKELITEPTPQVNAVLAELYLKERELNKAKIEIEKALRFDAQNDQYRLLYAGILESLDQSEKAEAQYRVLIGQSPDLPEPYLLLAALYGKRGDFSEGALLLKEFIGLVPENALGYELLVQFYERDGKYQEAERLLQSKIKSSGLDNQSFVTLERIYLRQEKTEKAKALALEMLKTSPDSVVAKRILGELAISEGSVEKGIEYLRGADRGVNGAGVDGSGGGSTSLRFRIALLELQRQNHEAAERELLLIIAQDPEHVQAKYHLASIYAGSDRKKEAYDILNSVKEDSALYSKIMLFSAFLLRQDQEYGKAAKKLYKVLDKDPEDTKTRSYLALILKDDKDFSEAEDVLKAGLELSPSEANREVLLFQLGVVYTEQEKEDLALEVMEEVIKLNPKNSDALNFIAYTLAEQGEDLSRAELLVRRALEVKDDDGYYLDTLGWILYLQTRYGEAEKVLEEAVGLVDDLIILEHYGDVLLKNGKRSEARGAYERALQLFEKEPVAEKQEVADRIFQKMTTL